MLLQYALLTLQYINVPCFMGLSYLNPEPQTLLAELNQRMAPQFGKLNKSLIELVNH